MCCFAPSYGVIPAHRNWEIETAVWNLAGFLHCAAALASETRWQRFGQFLNYFLYDLLCHGENLDFLYENHNFLCELREILDFLCDKSNDFLYDFLDS